MKFDVRLEFIGHKWVEGVEAETVEEAHEKALDIGVKLDASDFEYETEVTVYDSVIASKQS